MEMTTVTVNWLSRTAHAVPAPTRIGEVLHVIAPQQPFSFTDDPTAFREVETFNLFAEYVDDESGRTTLRWVMPPGIRIAL